MQNPQDTRPAAGEPPQPGATPEAPPAGEAAGAAAQPGPEERLAEAERKAAEHYEAWLRAKADLENTRRRAQEDIGKAGRFAVDKFAEAMLPVKDSLEATLKAESATLENLRAGVELTLRQLAAGLQSAGIVEVDPVGEKFDPHRHQAISTAEAEGEANRVLTVLQKGYMLHERVLRPALVIVSRAGGGAAAG